MTLKEQLQADVKTAMRAGDKERRDVLRGLLAAVKQEEIDSRTTLDDDGVQAVIRKQAKQRQETMADGERAGRDDLIAGAQKELAVIETYLPRMMSEEEVRVVAGQVVAEMGVTNMKGMGQVMGRLMAQLQGRADGRVVSQVVRDLLQ